MKCKYGQNGAYEKLFRPNCPDSPECYEFELYTNADRIRAMSDGELAEQLVVVVVAVNGLQPCTLYYSMPTERTFLTEAEAVRVTLEWLQQPAEGR